MKNIGDNKIQEKFYYSTGLARALLLKIFFKKLGGKVFIGKRFIGSGLNNVEIGSHTYINHDVEITALNNTITIGRDVMIAPFVYIGTFNHGYKEYTVPMSKQKRTSGRIDIGNDVWIGTKAVILPNVRIGQGAIIAAGAVVTKNIPPFAIAGGVPAKILKYRFKKDTIKKALAAND